MNESIIQLNQMGHIQAFESRIEERFQYTENNLDVLQVNMGKLCNLSCKHCHVEAGPNRKEIMRYEIMEACLSVCREQKVKTADITGRAPEMNPHFKWFVEEICKACSHVTVRSNLVILTEEGYRHLPKFFADHRIEVICSLPYYQAKVMSRVRGDGSLDKVIRVIQELSSLGCGREDDLILDMVYSPSGVFFPSVQRAMEKKYKAKLLGDYGIVFDHLFTIINNPTGRFFYFLQNSCDLNSYMRKLYDSFNQATVEDLMCRYQVPVGYNGGIYDCGFNQASDLPVSTSETIFDLVGKPYKVRKICFGSHCYGCMAGQGSSCGGATET